jgi:Planctomycete cytochrome C
MTHFTNSGALILLTLFLCLFSQVLPATAGESVPGTDEQIEHFEKHVRPLLANKCFDCHGTDTGDGGLKLTSREAVLAGGDVGPVVDLGKPSESLLLKAVQ